MLTPMDIFIHVCTLFSLTTVHILPTLLLVGLLGHLSFLHAICEHLTGKYLISSLTGLIPIQNSHQIRKYDYFKTYGPFKVIVVVYTFCVTAKKCTLQIKHISKSFSILKHYY